MTDTATTTTSPLVFQIYIRATVEQVWQAITETGFRRQYFFGSTIESDFRPGSPLRSVSPDGELWGDDTVLECEPPLLLAHTWRSLWAPGAAEEPASRVTWRIEPQDDGVCKLTVTHDRLEESPVTADSVRGGWARIISGLKSVLETGRSLTPEEPVAAPGSSEDAGAWYLYRLHAHRPDFAQTMTEAEMATMMEHVEYWRTPMAEGRVLIYSPVADPEHSWGMCVVRASSEAELTALRDDDPAYRAGIGTVDWLLLPLPVVVDLPVPA